MPNIYQAMAKAIEEMANPKKNKQNTHFKNRYADLGAVLECIEEPLRNNGLLLFQTPDTDEGGIFVLRTKLVQVGEGEGDWLSFDYPLPKVDDPQKIGSAISYARRYALKALFGMVDEDDDGEGFHGDRQPAKPARQEPAKAPAKKALEPFKEPADAAAAIGKAADAKELFEVGLRIKASSFHPDELTVFKEAVAIKQQNLKEHGE